MTERVALVTGAARGIGRAVSERLLHEVWRVALLDVDEAVRATSMQIDTALTTAHVVDVADDDAVGPEVDAVVDRHGRLDAVVSNAGIMIRRPIEQLSPAEWRRVLDVHLTGAFLVSKAAAPHLRASGNGGIVMIASTRARQSEPDTEAYAAAKGGLVAYTHALAISLGPAVRVNCISPGWIDTGGEELVPEDHAQHPAGRVGRPEDVAGLVAWLLSSDAGFTTGAELLLDGGMTRRMIYVE